VAWDSLALRANGAPVFSAPNEGLTVVGGSASALGGPTNPPMGGFFMGGGGGFGGVLGATGGNSGNGGGGAGGSGGGGAGGGGGSPGGPSNGGNSGNQGSNSFYNPPVSSLSVNEPAAGVPDGGSTALLGGIALCALMFFRRKARS
jgi:hypothetical protein